jgi:topoisomerase IV subunit B
VRDFGRGIPLGKLLDCAAQINTGAKYDSEAFKKSVGLNGVGIKAVNALSDFSSRLWREKTKAPARISKGELTQRHGTRARPTGRTAPACAFKPDAAIFRLSAKSQRIRRRACGTTPT